jgi:hypothetical protein
MFQGVLRPVHLVVIVGMAPLVFGPRNCLNWAEGSAMAYGSAMRDISESADVKLPKL